MNLPTLLGGNDEAWMSALGRPCAPPINDPVYIRDHADSFYPRKKFYDQAAKLCIGCPVVNQCLQYAIDHREMDGIWGGTTPKQRATILRRIDREGAA